MSVQDLKTRFGSLAIADWSSRVGIAVARYGLALILLLMGIVKFTHAAGLGIQPFIAHSPFLSWPYSLASVDAVSRGFGLIELVTAFAIVVRPVFPAVSALGSILAAGAHATTTSFLVTTPGVWDPAFPLLGTTGSFLSKDIVLLGAALFMAGEAKHAAFGKSSRP